MGTFILFLLGLGRPEIGMDGQASLRYRPIRRVCQLLLLQRWHACVPSRASHTLGQRPEP